MSMFSKPTLNGDYGAWGTKLNSNWDKMEVFNTTIESNLGFEYDGTDKTSGICNIFGGNLEYDIDTNTLSLTGTFDAPTITSPLINGEASGTSVSTTPTANKLVKYDANGGITANKCTANTEIITPKIYTNTVNPLDLGDSAEVVNFEVTDTTTLKDLVVTGSVTANKYTANTEIITPKIYTNTVNPLDLGDSAEVVNFEVTDTTTLKDLVVTGSVTGIPTGSSNVLTSDLNWSVGVGLDFEDLQSALQEASKYITTLKTGLSSSTSEQKSYVINITIEDGHIIDYWIFLESVDLSFVNVFYAGAGSLTISTLSGVVSSLGFIYGKNSKLPKFNCDFSISATANTGIPLLCLDNSELFLKNTEIDSSLNTTSGDIEAYNNSVINLNGVTSNSNLWCDNCNIFLNSSTLAALEMYDSYCSSNYPAIIRLDKLYVVSSNLKLNTLQVKGRIHIYKKSDVLLENLVQTYTTDGSDTDYCIKIENGSSLWLRGSSQTITFTSAKDENIVVDNSNLRIETATLPTGTNSYAITSLNGSITSLVNVTATKNISVNTLNAKGIIFNN